MDSAKQLPRQTDWKFRRDSLKQLHLPEPLLSLLSVLVGLFVSIYMQTVNGWWLNMPPWPTCAALLGVAFGLSVVSAGSPFARLIALWFGAQIGFTWYLFRIGPGNLFPIVIGVGAVISGIAILIGGGLGWLFGRLLPGQRKKA